jgi:hypothetical protein
MAMAMAMAILTSVSVALEMATAMKSLIEMLRFDKNLKYNSVNLTRTQIIYLRFFLNVPNIFSSFRFRDK